ncbi:MAG: dehydrogenase E1 component subunit alpha/beta [Actinomycetota bacterium]
MGRAQTKAAPKKHRGIAADEAIADFRLACISRAIDDREIVLRQQSKVFFQISGAGHEALYLGLARHLQPGYDWFFPYYRDGALMLGLGISAKDLLLQAVGSADDPASGGRQMPCHWSFPEANVVTQSSATGSQCIPAVGCAEAARYIVRRPDLPGCEAYGDELTYVSLGEGACSQGEFWESLNTACTLHLPVLFVVADNGYAISVPSDDQHPAPVSDLVRGFRGLAIHKMDGRDYFEVRSKGRKAIERVRAGEGPGLIHAVVTRPYSHSLSDDQKRYRTPEELAEEQEYDPIDQLERELVGAGILSEEEAAQIRQDAKDHVAQAAQEALAAPRPDPATVLHHLTGPVPDITEGDAGQDGDVVTFGEAIRLTLHEVMASDERVRLFGEDVADAPTDEALEGVAGKGGVFGITHGLQRRFGKARCFNSPLAEANIIGRAVGQGVRGLKPCAEIQFFDYIWTAMQQIRTEAATTRWRSDGKWAAPMVIRVPIGGYLQGGSIWHSQSGESIFTHTPGLFVVFPSRARDAAGLLRTAFDCDDPVLFLEHKHLYRQMYNRDPFPDVDYRVPLGKAAYVTRGDDITLVTYGATVQRSVVAARELEKDGVSVEIIDLRSLQPWDKETVAESVKKTSRLLVVHEDILEFGFGAEVSAWVTEHCFFDLDAPVMRVGAKFSWVAYEPTLEDAILPQTSDIGDALRRLAAI